MYIYVTTYIYARGRVLERKVLIGEHIVYICISVYYLYMRGAHWDPFVPGPAYAIERNTHIYIYIHMCHYVYICERSCV